MSFVIAIDGPAAAGKGTLAKGLARHFGFAHLDTGLLYRGVGAKVLEGQDPIDAAQSLSAGDLASPMVRMAEVARAASEVAALPEVRAALRKLQRDFAQRKGGAILDGRDIGTVICPDAAIKLFITASAQVRAQRRLQELRAMGAQVSPAQVLAEVKARDRRDRLRSESPLVPAADAIVLDNSHLTGAEVLRQAIAIITEKRAKQGAQGA